MDAVWMPPTGQPPPPAAPHAAGSLRASKPWLSTGMPWLSTGMPCPPVMPPDIVSMPAGAYTSWPADACCCCGKVTGCMAGMYALGCMAGFRGICVMSGCGCGSCCWP
eukprot:scaffold304412_cov19-Tisochrysis_lutea.AAC.2